MKNIDLEQISKPLNKPTLCRDCKYLIKPNFFNRFILGSKALTYAHCSHPDAEWKKDWVTGKKEYAFCSCMRDFESHCGASGKFFESKRPRGSIA